jgi:hypothetical protein
MLNKFIIKYYLKPCGSIKKIYNMVSFINSGSYNDTYIIKDMDTFREYVYRKNRESIESPTLIINNYIETFIHCFLTIY